MVVQKELGQAAEDFDDKLLKTIKDMMCFDKDERTKIYDLIKETGITTLLCLCVDLDLYI